MVGPINPTSHGYRWILVVTKYFTKWAEAIPLCKATRGVMANSIKENIIVQFGVLHRIISNNGTAFVNKEVRKILELYQVKRHRSSPYYSQQKKTLITIISKTSQEYCRGWATDLPNAL